MPSIVKPARAQRPCVSASTSTSGVQHRVHGGAEDASSSRHLGISSSTRMTSTGRLEWISTMGRSAKIFFSSRDVPIAASLPALMIAMRWQCSASSR